MKVRLTRQIQFASAHLYHQPKWSEEENKRVFGLCFSQHGHGHNYILQATLEGPIDPLSGMIMNLSDLDVALKKVTEPLDHHHLNFEVPEFKSRIPTTENIAIYCYEKLKPLVEPHARLISVRVYERSDLYAEVMRDDHS